MAYIDPDGMFGGDRMAMLSDSAKMSWPWFWCASNSVGRIELNYRAFCDGPFRQFHKPPTERQFWDWVTEFHDAYLMFVYQVNGKAWGQWDVSERYLPKYKHKSDERTPAPMARPWLIWREQYQSKKVEALSAKCRIFSGSEKFPEAENISSQFPIGIGGGSGSGEELKPFAADTAGDGPSFPVDLSGEAPPRSWFDAHHEQFYGTFWRKVGKKDSRKAYERRVRILVSGGMDFEAATQFLLDQVKLDRLRFQDTQDWDWRQNLHPATWLNGERWTDEARARAPTSGLGRTAAQVRRDETVAGLNLIDQIRGT